MLLETERLKLRPLTLDDVDPLVEVLGDAHSMRFYPHPFERAEVVRWIERQIDLYRTEGFGLWGLELKDGGRMIGDCGLTPQTPIEAEEIEVGWHVHPRFQRMGYASEAATACRDWGFDNLDVEQLISMIRPENVPSQGVARKIGMTRGEHFYYKDTLHELWSVARPG